MLNDILQVANKYATGLEHVVRRRNEWLEKHQIVMARMKEIAEHLNANTTYKQPFYVDRSHAFNEEINGTCKQIPSVTLRTGDMPMLVTFKNNAGDHKEWMEEGFRITFSPTITGQIVVLFHPHSSNLDAPNDQPQFKTMAVINEPDQITNDVIDQIVTKGIEFAYYTSFTGLGEMRPENDGVQNRPNPIGFKKYESTEKNGN
jgi:hypothetical protein